MVETKGSTEMRAENAWKGGKNGENDDSGGSPVAKLSLGFIEIRGEGKGGGAGRRGT